MRSRSAPAGEVTLGAKARALARSPRPPAAAVTVVQRARVGAEEHRQQAPENDEEDDEKRCHASRMPVLVYKHKSIFLS